MSILINSLPRFLAVLLFDGAIPRVLVAEDEMQFVVVSALVGPKHDGVRGLIVELAKVCHGVRAF